MAFVIVAGAADAQNILKLDALKAEKGIVERHQKVAPDELKKPLKARKKIQLEDNQKIFGMYDTDDLATAIEGLGLPNYPGNLRAATIIPVSAGSKFDGGKITAIRFGICQPVGASRVFIIPMNDKGQLGSEVVSQDVASTSAGWNMVELTSPYTIDASTVSGYLVGFDYTQVNTNDGQYYDDACYPLSIVDAGTSVSPTYIYGNLGQGTAWYDIGAEQYGNLSVQCIVEKEGGYPQYDLIMGQVYTVPFVKAGNTLPLSTGVFNDGKSAPANYTLGVAVDGKEVKEISRNAPVFSEYGDEIEDNVTVPNDIAKGSHTLSVYVKTINGAVPTEATSDDMASTEFNVYVESMQRQKQLVEHFTSQYCTYCPLGISVLEGLVAKRNDIAWVSVHGDMQTGTDQYTIEEGNYIAGFQTQGFPSASFNRLPISGAGEVAIGIGFNANQKEQAINYLSSIIDYTNEVPAFASVAIDTKYDDATRTLDITVSGQTTDDFNLFVGDDAALTVYLTEDGLVSKQLNQGKWIASFTHDNVLRKVVTNYYGDAMNMNGNGYENKYSVTLNEKWNKDNMHVVAMVSRKPKQENLIDKLWVTNTEIAAVKDAATGISSAINNGSEVKEVARYNANGMLLSGPQKGINIVKLSNGSTIKVVVE